MSYEDESYEELLNKSWDEVPTNVLLPEGSYRLRSSGASYVKAKSAGDKPQIMFTYTVKEPLEDVDQDELDKIKPDDIVGKKVFHKVWLETGADWDQVRKHLAMLGVSIDGRSPKESLKDTKGHEIIGYLGVKTFQTKAGETVTDNQPSYFAPVED